ncbi:PREDICTED: uncharacterized protein C20orf202 homolog [Condylura cristata]|uniref:uncharacterized protein C20orf202 homolog n=1 Tax=Condylura cristata TaxID=143302 RepID=UPI00033453DC|nr:PREDICTED: uncharacterized protein C20orf202 homolog [Condylura cristata]
MTCLEEITSGPCVQKGCEDHSEKDTVQAKGPTTGGVQFSQDTEMKTAGAPAMNLGQTLEWLRRELAEMQIQDQRLLLTLKHLHSVLEELRAESARWEDSRSSRGTSPIRARAGSESRAWQPMASRRLAQAFPGVDSRRSSLP